MDDIIKEQIKDKTERLKILALTGLASAGGTVSLLLRDEDPYELV